MALDGFVIAAVKKELNDKLIGGRLYKIAQPEEDELIITIKNNKEQYRLLISANASLPLIYLTEENKPSPLTAFFVSICRMAVSYPLPSRDLKESCVLRLNI